MTKSTRLAFAVAVLSLPIGASPIGGTKGPVEIHAPALAPRLHIKSFTIVSPACGKQADLRVEIQNLTGAPLVGSTGFNTGMNPAVVVQWVSKPNVLMWPLPSVGGGATVSIPVGGPPLVTACPSDNCWEVRLARAGPGGATSALAEWDGKVARICAKTSCVHDPRVVSKSKSPCTFEIYSPGPR